MAPQNNLHIAVIGHVDHGKSTIAGRLLFELGIVSEEKINEYRTQAAYFGAKKHSEFAWVFDKTKEERIKGESMFVSYEPISIDGKRIVIVDGPGHESNITNMIVAIGEADAALLVVDVEEGVKPQTKEHSLIAHAFGINRLVVAINKMDKPNIEFSKKAYEKTRNELLDTLVSIGFDQKLIQFLPISGYLGNNLVKKNEKLKWFDGPSLFEAISKLEFSTLSADMPFRLPIDLVFSKKGAGTIVTGKIISGKVKKNDQIIAVPGNVKSRVKSIQIFKKDVDSALEGDSVGIGLAGVSRDQVKTGTVLGSVDSPPNSVKRILAKIRILSKSESIIKGYNPALFANSTHTGVKFLDIVSLVNETGKQVKRNPLEISYPDIAYVELEMAKRMAMEEIEKFPKLARFIIRDKDVTIAAGVCEEKIE